MSESKKPNKLSSSQDTQKPQIETKSDLKIQTTQQIMQLNSKISGQTKQNKLDGKKLSLVLFEIAKQQNSIFSQSQKDPIRSSFVATILSICTATVINLTQIAIKPQKKNKKWFVILGMGNIVGSVIFGGYGIYLMNELSYKVPQYEWQRIKKQKQEYEKLQFNKRKQYLKNRMQNQEKNQNQLNQQLQQLKKQLTQQKIYLTK